MSGSGANGFAAPITNGVNTTGTRVGARPDVSPGEETKLGGSAHTWKRWINTEACTIYTDPTTKQNLFYGRFGTAPRTNAVRLPGLFNIDFSANKRFSVGENRYFEFRTEIFNLANHYNPDVASVDLNIRSQTFGTIGGGARGTPNSSDNGSHSYGESLRSRGTDGSGSRSYGTEPGPRYSTDHLHSTHLPLATTQHSQDSTTAKTCTAGN